MREIKVSVIIPIYNVEEYLEECLQSVVDQTLEDLQVIMVDDGSLDGSTDIAKKFASRYDHFEYVRQVNGGLGNARNTLFFLIQMILFQMMHTRKCILQQRKIIARW
jgi:CDP-glycerol glycerophosphotransferase